MHMLGPHTIFLLPHASGNNNKKMTTVNGVLHEEGWKGEPVALLLQSTLDLYT